MLNRAGALRGTAAHTGPLVPICLAGEGKDLSYCCPLLRKNTGAGEVLGL